MQPSMMQPSFAQPSMFQQQPIFYPASPATPSNGNSDAFVSHLRDNYSRLRDAYGTLLEKHELVREQHHRHIVQLDEQHRRELDHLRKELSLQHKAEMDDLKRQLEAVRLNSSATFGNQTAMNSAAVEEMRHLNGQIRRRIEDILRK